MGSPTPNYLALSVLKQRLDLADDDTTWDTDLTDAILEASASIDEMCDRQFTVDTEPETRTFIPVNPGYCIIDELSAVPTLVSAQASTWTFGQDYYLEPQNAAALGRPYTAIKTIARPFIFTQAEVGPGWVAFDQRVSVTGLFGWPAVPNQIARACSILAAKFFLRKDSVQGVLAVGADATAIRLGSYDPDITTLLDPFTRTVLF